ncbi:MAG: helix-turn-helix transcriptional regulator [Anaerolineaceae bacterium]|nr:helix-turn-helix transcriptional regulator [Anaerolineaceae bacterium]
MNDIEFGKRLEQIRDAVGISQLQMASYLGVTQSFISRCEKGERQFSVDALEKICNLYGCTLQELESDKEIKPQFMFAFRANLLCDTDIEAIASINKIIINMEEMTTILEDYDKRHRDE